MYQAEGLISVCALALVVCVGTASAAGRGHAGGRHGGGHGIGGHALGAHHGGLRHGGLRRGGRLNRYFPGYYGGYVVIPNTYVNRVEAEPLPSPPPPLVPPTFGLSCRHSQQIVTVPSEEGGKRRITITRC